MNVILWIVASLLGAAFLGAGLMKVSLPKAKLAASGMAWTDDFSPPMVKTIGTLEILAGIGLILPAVVDIAPVLVPLAALGLAVIMIGAGFPHYRRKEYEVIGFNVVLLLLAELVVWGRLGP